MRILRVALVAASVLALNACTTLATPVLRHQTGEALGSGRIRTSAHIETSRIYAPGVDAISSIASFAQGSSVFTGLLFGIGGEVGVLSKLDLQFGANFSSTGGGWRIGSKYQILKVGRIAVAGMLGYGVTSGSGGVTYLNSAGGAVDLDQVLTSSMLDVTFPVSFRISPTVIAYSGLLFNHASITGSFGGTVVGETFNDLGINLGIRVSVSRFEIGAESAFLRVHDPFVNSERLIPYLGVSFAVLF